jgi:hypothetical protein
VSRRTGVGGLVALAGGVALAVSMFLPWFRFQGGASVSLWRYLKHLKTIGAVFSSHGAKWLRYLEFLVPVIAELAIVLGFAVLVLGAARAVRAGWPGRLELALIAAGAIGVLYVLFNILLGPANFLSFSSLTDFGQKFVYRRQYGEFIALAAAAAVLAGGLVSVLGRVERPTQWRPLAPPPA